MFPKNTIKNWKTKFCAPRNKIKNTFEKLNSKVYPKLKINFGVPKLQKDYEELKIFYPNLHLRKKLKIESWITRNTVTNISEKIKLCITKITNTFEKQNNE